MKELKIIYKAPGELTPYANNPRNNADAVEAVAQSIEAYGFRAPIQIDDNNIVVAGDTRLKAAIKLGLKTVPCIVVTGLTPEQLRAYRIADNKVGEFAEWDFDKLADELAALQDADANLLETGFSEKEIDGLLKEVGYDESEMYGNEFSLPEGDKENLRQATFTLTNEQYDLIFEALDMVKKEITETFGNENNNGNRLYEVVRQWVEQRKLN